MVTVPILRDATVGIEAIFGDATEFSCLTGSCIDSTANSDRSDLDLVVVLRDNIELVEALTFRAEFTRFYIRLHQDHDRAPDLKWPGEVLYRSELDDALHGATFKDSGRSITAPTLCGPDKPYRYWVSMVATGIPLTGAAAFTPYAEASARLLATHAAMMLASERKTDSKHYWATTWHLPVPTETNRAWRIARQTPDDRDILQAHEPAATPKLERYAERWSRFACEARISPKHHFVG